MRYSRYYLTEEIKPNVTTEGNVAFAADDVLFDWTAFEIPKGASALRSFMIKIMGTNSVAQTQNIDIFFAKSIDGVAPPSIGVSNAEKDVIKTVAARPFIIGYQGIDGSTVEDVANSLVSYNVLQNGKPEATLADKVAPIILEGELDYAGTTQGFQTLFVAATSAASLDFGTSVLVAGEHAADDLTIVVDGSVGGDDVFAIGDEVVAFAADGSLPKVVGKLTAVADNLLTVDAAPVILPNNHEICHKNPITLRFGFER